MTLLPRYLIQLHVDNSEMEGEQGVFSKAA